MLHVHVFMATLIRLGDVGRKDLYAYEWIEPSFFYLFMLKYNLASEYALKTARIVFIIKNLILLKTPWKKLDVSLQLCQSYSGVVRCSMRFIMWLHDCLPHFITVMLHLAWMQIGKYTNSEHHLLRVLGSPYQISCMQKRLQSVFHMLALPCVINKNRD